jgi:hypothetical protein
MSWGDMKVVHRHEFISLRILRGFRNVIAMVTISPSELQGYVLLPRTESVFLPVANTTIEDIGTYVEAIEKQKKRTLVNGPNAGDPHQLDGRAARPRAFTILKSLERQSRKAPSGQSPCPY